MHRFLLVFFISIFLLYPGHIVHASTYGSGDYGDGYYSPTNTPTPVPNNSSSGSNNSGSSSSASNSECSATAPGSSPFLYQVDRLGQKATLYFAPVSKPYNKYVISYGIDESAENYNATIDISDSDGAIDYTVNLLEPGTTYYFKVQAFNGCKPSGWSNVIKGEGISSNLITKASFYPSWYQNVSHVVTSGVRTVTNAVRNVVSNTSTSQNTIQESGSTTDSVEAPSVQDKPVQQVQPVQQQKTQTSTGTPQQSTGNWFTNMWNGFLNIFR